MPKLPRSHILAHRGVTEVCAVLSRADALSEIIKNDYGEDLLIQTHINGLADAFNILIQVKCISGNINQYSETSIRIDVDHLLRWVSHAAPVIVCVYSVATDQIFAFSPREIFTLWQLHTSKTKTKTINLNKNFLFDENAAYILIWKCRIEYYSRMLSYYQNTMHQLQSDLPIRKRHRSLNFEIGSIVMAFLSSLNFCDNDNFSESFKRTIINGSKNLSSRTDDNFGIEHVFALALLKQVESIVPGIGLPENLIEEGSFVLENYFDACHHDVWEKAKRYFAVV